MIQEESSGLEYDDLEVYSEQILKNNVEKWAKDLAARVSGVSLTSPQASLKCVSRKKPAKGKAPTGVCFQSEKMARGQEIPWAIYLKALGLKVGIISKLCSNVMKYKVHQSISH
ncbi:hypothetical protein VP01_2468g2 [Puccinia sorghi]|uniref:Uncharacterized protein n=1 Tax=Puccinia sorghi TaxID=27349 RepID=A0A0L6V6N8_9BASI|nr:hypothetical protein VP01_2468g2 [Puccinia sorghi]